MKPVARLDTISKYTRKCLDCLGLSSWELKVRWMTKEESEGEFKHCNGFCRWQEEYQYAEIVLSKDVEDWRHTAWHEALHIRLEGHKPMRTKRDTNLEIVINQLVKPLMRIG